MGLLPLFGLIPLGLISRWANTIWAYVERVGDGSGRGAGRERGRGHPFEISPPPPRLSRKGALRAGSSINAPIRDNRGGGALISKGCVE